MMHSRAMNIKSGKGQYDSSDSTKFIIKKSSENGSQKADTLVVIFGFYGATERAIKNYCDMYQSFGFDVMHVPSHLKHFAWPKNSLDLSCDVLSYLNTSCSSYDQIIVHAFSMGAYNFTVCMGEMYSKPELYGNIHDRIKAVIYDSLTIGELGNMAVGVGLGLSSNKIIQTAIPFAISIFFQLTYPWTVKFYNKYIDLFKQKPLEIPTLLYACKNDPMSQYEVLEVLEKYWHEKFNFPLVFHSWDKSKHSAHLQVHKNEYTQILTKFLCCVPGLIKSHKILSRL